ncbi:MAG: aldehyde reductase [Bdellovibrionota bacterium]|nr:aldehyde reductase [Bdellovibrionota bacterium]
MTGKVLVTGGTGYIGSWVVKDLLNKGHHVKVTVRDIKKTSRYKFLENLAEASSGSLEVFQADLLDEGSYDDIVKDCEGVFHIASPFKLKFKNGKSDFLDPALKGTRNVLNAVNKSGSVKKVVLTSSVSAIYGDNLDMKEKGLNEFTEEHFNTTSSLKHGPYAYSKLMAEKEAWKMQKEQDSWELVTINPSMVMGPLLNSDSQSGSISLMADLLGGKMGPAIPSLNFGYVDVRDISKAHLSAYENSQAKGRYILCERTMNMLDLAKMINGMDFKFKVPERIAPQFILYLTGWMFGMTPSFVKRNVGIPVHLNNSKGQKELGVNYIPIETTIKEMIDSFIEHKLVKN